MKAEARRAALIEAATRCFAKRGYHATSISNIIAKAGVARGTFYLYFKSKQDVFCEILDAFIGHLDKQILTIALGTPEPPARQMRANVVRLVDAILKEPGPAKIIFNEAVGLNPEIDERLEAFYAKLLRRIEASLKKGIALGLVRDVCPRVAACIIIGAFRELMVQKIVFHKPGLARKVMIDGLIDTILGGLGAGPIGGRATPLT